MTRLPNERTVSVALTIAAVGCTAYTADTNWHFADHYLGMNSALELTLFVASGAVALVASVSIARLRRSSNQTPLGLPQFLVWVITGFHIFAAYAESGLVAGTVRAFTGPILTALLWHYVFDVNSHHRVVKADPQPSPHRAERTRTSPPATASPNPAVTPDMPAVRHCPTEEPETNPRQYRHSADPVDIPPSS